MQNARHPKTHRELCELACRFLRNNGFKVVFGDRFHAWTPCGEHPDALGFRNGASCLIEVKCSRSDFLADRKKVFRAEPEKGMGDWRFYLCVTNGAIVIHTQRLKSDPGGNLLS